MFLKHNVQDVFCLYLQHGHHKIEQHQAIEKVGGTAHVMNDAEISDIERFGDQVVPSTWMSTQGGMLPMEYSVTPSESVHAFKLATLVVSYLPVIIGMISLCPLMNSC